MRLKRDKGQRVLDEQIGEAWQARKRAVCINPSPRFTSEGLVLGACTVLLASDGARTLKSLKGQEPRVSALLSAAYGRAVAPSMLVTKPCSTSLTTPVMVNNKPLQRTPTATSFTTKRVGSSAAYLLMAAF